MTRLDEIERKLEALEAAVARFKAAPPCPRYVGIFRGHNEYQSGDLATHAGGLWLACRPTSARPGTDDCGWQLIVKSGEAPR